ncbi:MAG: DNA primase [Planctomycetota bacterium]
MPGLYSEDIKQRVRTANNLVDIVQSAVGKLTRAGRNLKACCPFHNEKTASFNVNLEGQYFKCFGCGKSGDVFTFVMLHERVDFPEAFRILADRAGIRIEDNPQAAIQYKKETDWKSYLYKLNDAAARFYREQLFANAGNAAREYLKKRQLSDEICEKFQIGYAPVGSSPLLERLQSLKAPPTAIVKAGLATQRDDGSVRDFFYDRLMFPIRDIQNRVIAFGGRILGDGEPKYLNTRETPLFSKTHTVYGLDQAKEQIVKTRQAILVEGYTDVMMCHQFGIANVVACLGTAITSEHIRRLRRMADELILLTDADTAGARASERSLDVLFTEQMPAQIARLPDLQKDPCDYLLANGKDAFLAAIKQRLDLFEYKFDMVRQKYDLLAPAGLKNAAEELMALISLIPDTLLKNRYRYEVLKRLNVDERDLRYEVRNVPVASSTDRETGADDIGVLSAPETELAQAERELLRFLFHEPAWLETALAQVDLAAFTGGPESAIGRALLEGLGEGRLPLDMSVIDPNNAGSMIAREIIPRLRDENKNGIVKAVSAAQSLCVALAEHPPTGSKFDIERRLNILTNHIRKAALSLQCQEAARHWTHAKLNGDTAVEEEAYNQLVLLRKELVKLKSCSGKKLR